MDGVGRWSERPAARVLIAVILAALFVGGALVHAQRVNVDWRTHDQGSYIAYAKSIHDSRGQALGNRLQMPAVPELLSTFYRDGETPAEFFPRAKLVCIALGALAATLAGVLLWWRLPRAPAAVVGCVAVFFVFAFRAGYVQAEPLSYVSIFALFLAMTDAWRRPSWPLAAAIGLVLAAAFMIKATALLGFYVFALCVVSRAAVRVVRGPSASDAVPLAQLALSFGIFLAAIWPYASNSRRHFGQYLYNTSSTYVMWCDSWEDFLSRIARHDELPTFRTYWQTHTLGQMAWRELRGLGEVLGNCLISHGYALFVLLYLAIFVAMVRKHADVKHALFRRDPHAPAWFVVPYLLAHLLLFGWYGPIAAGNRFILGMLLPSMYSVAAGLSAHAKPEHALELRGRSFDWTKLNVAILVLVAVHLVLYFPYAIATHYSGG
ncbi:MAG TPA: hypothetical protein VLM85_30080 [Polyangiaceae bacterium]|nr:hypothetical protein [Polyangiaceae bacterium]